MHALQPATTGLSAKTALIPLHNRGVGGQIGRVLTHQIVSKFVERSGAKVGRSALLIAMAARLTCEVGASQVANRCTKRRDAAPDTARPVHKICKLAFAKLQNTRHYRRYAKTQRFYRIKRIAGPRPDLPHGASPAYRCASVHAVSDPQRQDCRSV